MDKLDLIFQKQKELYEAVEELMNVKVDYKDLILAMHSELDEILQEFPWKHWRSYPNFETDNNHLLEECIDLLTFLTEFIIMIGYSSEDVYEMYCKKNEKNIQRLSCESIEKEATNGNNKQKY